MKVDAAELNGIFALADAVAAGQDLSLESFGQLSGAIEGSTFGGRNWRLRLGLSVPLADRFFLVADVLGG